MLYVPASGGDFFIEVVKDQTSIIITSKVVESWQPKSLTIDFLIMMAMQPVFAATCGSIVDLYYLDELV